MNDNERNEEIIEREEEKEKDEDLGGDKIGLREFGEKSERK